MTHGNEMTITMVREPTISLILLTLLNNFARKSLYLLAQITLAIIVTLTTAFSLIVFTPLILFLTIYTAFDDNNNNNNNNTSSNDNDESRPSPFKPYISVLYEDDSDNDDYTSNDDDDNASVRSYDSTITTATTTTTTRMNTEDFYDITSGQIKLDLNSPNLFTLTCTTHSNRHDGVRGFRFGIKRV